MNLITNEDAGHVGVYLTPHAPHPMCETLYLAQRGRCFYCDAAMSPRPSDHTRDGKEVLRKLNQRRKKAGKLTKRVGGWTVDHVFPRAIAYATTNNVVLSCGQCNCNKGSSMPTADEIGRAILMYASAGYAFAPRRASSHKHFEFSRTHCSRLPLGTPLANKTIQRSTRNVRVPFDRPIP